MKVNDIGNLLYSTKPLRQAIKDIKPYTKENVTEIYGSIGADIFEGKKISIVDKTKLTGKFAFLNKLAEFLGLKSYQCEYQQIDSFFNIWNKYIGNYGSGLVSDLHEKFGKCGDKMLKIWQNIDYIKV